MEESNKLYFGNEINELNRLVKRGMFSRVVVITDDHCEELVWPVFREIIDFQPVDILTIPHGEQNKTMDTLLALTDKMVKVIDRKSLIINLGGGVVTDLGGFATSVFKRGVAFVHIPTTLLAMTDAAIGGKTGVNHGHYKNMLGVFNRPLGVFIYDGFLKTLPERELYSGFAEMLKIALMRDKDFFDELSALPSPKAIDLKKIKKAALLKEETARLDFKEAGVRRLLNFGHTAGHALESFSLGRDAEPLSHGHAVALGMMIETILSETAGICSKQTADEVIEALRKFYPLYPAEDENIDELLEIMKADKKNEAGRINFTLLRAKGRGFFNQFPDIELVKQAFEIYLAWKQ